VLVSFWRAVRLEAEAFLAERSDLKLADGRTRPVRHLRQVIRRAGLSLGDRACLALTSKSGRTPLTAGRAWISIAREAGLSIELIR